MSNDSTQLPTAVSIARGPEAGTTAAGAADSCGCAHETTERTPAWHAAARRVRWLSWFSLLWMTAEGAVGLTAGTAAHSISLIGWALGSVIEGLAAVIVIWRFTGTRTLSETSERRAQKAVAVSFWLLAPYLIIESVRHLTSHVDTSSSTLGIVVTAASVVVMPALGLIKRRLAAQVDSEATAGEGTQNLLCAAQGAAVLIGLAATAQFGWTWLDPALALAIAVIAVREGREAWNGKDCC